MFYLTCFVSASFVLNADGTDLLRRAELLAVFETKPGMMARSLCFSPQSPDMMAYRKGLPVLTLSSARIRRPIKRLKLCPVYYGVLRRGGRRAGVSRAMAAGGSLRPLVSGGTWRS